MQYTMFQNNTTKDVSGDLSVYLAKFADLRAELDIADDKYDHAIEELGTLGITNVRLVEMVHESRGRVGELEKEVSELRRSEERVRKRLQRCKCTRCQRRFDASPILDAVGDTSTRCASPWLRPDTLCLTCAAF
jgi:predicted nuclease with TOPRIM domain